MTSELVAAWRMSQEANTFLLSKLSKAQLAASYSARTRSVAAQFAHMHNTRCRWLGHVRRPAVSPGSFPRGATPNKTELKRALNASSKAVEAFLLECEGRGSVPSWDGPPTTFLAYLVAHEAHHRGLAMVALRTEGHKLPSEVVYGLWQWGKRRNLRG